MADSIDRSRIDSAGDGADHSHAPGADPTAGACDALAVVEAKMRFPGGFDGVTEWMDTVSSIVDALSSEELDRTRAEIRDLIDQLLELNAQVQNIVRLKQLLS